MRTTFYKAWLLATLLFYFGTTYLFAERLEEGIEYKAEASAIVSNGDFAPFWMTNNKYGLSTTKNNSGYLRAGIFRDAKIDYNKDWRFGYGADIAVPFGMPSNFILQQIYGDFQWKALRLNIGQKERPLELKNQMLSSGGMTSGINARPIPQIRLELPDFWTIPGTKNWAAVKAHIAYGWYTDNAWQREFNNGNTNYSYTASSLYHSKAGFLRIGNAEKFPVSLTGGFEMSSQFGGEAWNLRDRADHQGAFDPHQKMGSGIKDYWNAFIPGGSDANDGNYANASGNQLGSWHFRMNYERQGWGAALNYEHFFEDHSQLFWQYGWKDGLVGAEISFPRNPFISTILFEYIKTDDQSGSIYHDATNTLPIQISAIDEYYNHHIYGAWQHAGFCMGNPLLISPVYHNDNHLICYDNRIRAYHFGFEGQPISELNYRILFTHEKSLGTYLIPRTDPLYGNFLLAELTYHPSQINGLGITVSYGQNGGHLLGHSKGCMIALSYSGKTNHKK